MCLRRVLNRGQHRCNSHNLQECHGQAGFESAFLSVFESTVEKVLLIFAVYTKRTSSQNVFCPGFGFDGHHQKTILATCKEHYEQLTTFGSFGAIIDWRFRAQLLGTAVDQLVQRAPGASFVPLVAKGDWWLKLREPLRK